jgi:ABC-2 type transport system permease protein
MFLCGILWPISSMPNYLQWIADFLPLTYGAEGMRGLMIQGQNLLDIIKDVGILAGYAVVLMILAALTTRRGAA